METYPTWPNLAAMMFARAREWPKKPMLRAWRDKRWQDIAWDQFARMAASLARHLRAAGVAAGDRVVICADNRPEYPIVETALMAIRAVPVPAYTTNTIADHAHVLRDCGARAAIVGNDAMAARFREAGELDLLVTMDGPDWARMTADTARPDDIAAETALIPSGALACLIYTSGTGGAPKGVMLPHRSILANCEGAFELVRPLKLKDETYLSFLPLSHSYEHTVGQFFLLSIGTEIVYSRGVEHLVSDMQTVRPTILTLVPRILEVIRSRVLGQVEREKPLKQAIFHRALDIGLKRIDGAGLSLLDRVLDPVLDRMVRAKVRARFGGRVVAAMSGGARLDPDVGRFFLALGIPILQGYGQTEAGPVISANPPHSIRIETVGPPLHNVELRLAEDGEILVRGGLVMDGYWGRPDDTAATVIDGWLHTGDIGELDADGYLRITDRKKDMIVLSGGDNVSPARIEGMLAAEPEIAQAVVLGDGQAGLTALLVAAEGVEEAAVARAVTRANQRLSVIERIRRHALVEPFTVENGMLTPTQKVRRGVVARVHAETLRRVSGG